MNDAPKASIDSPRHGATFALADSIEFAGSGTDPEDGNLTGSSLVWTSSLDDQIGTGRSFWATLSEGRHTITLTVADSEGATGVDSIRIDVTPPETNQPPSALITAPAGGATYPTTSRITFAGAGTDPEDGVLTGSSLVWTSSLDGQIGTGRSFSTTLSEGAHTIALTATDSQGATGVHSITVNVITPTTNQPPSATIDAPADGSTHQSTDQIDFAGTGTDPEDGDLTGPSLVWTSNIDGTIGTGVSFSRTLSEGSHTITLSVTDSGSLSASASIGIEVESLPPEDTTAPDNTTGLNFINAGASSADNPVLSLALSAQDNVAVTGYYVASNETGVAPAEPAGNAVGWTALTPAAVFSDDVAYTIAPGLPHGSDCHVYVWFKDAAGNVSDVATDSITSEDSIPPDNTTGADFIDHGAPTTASGNVTLTLAGTDNWGVSAYYVAENDTGIDPATPDARAAGWTDVDAATSYSANVAYDLTDTYQDGDTLFLFVWLKDGSGNVSAVASDSIVWSEPTYEIVYAYGFEDGWDSWWAEHGIWEVGTPTANPTGCPEKLQCAGTVLDGSYHTQTDSRLVSPTLVLPGVTGAEELHLRFWTWFSYVTYDAGYVQVSVYDEDDGWSDWTTVGSPITFTSVSWTLSSVELTAYAGQTVRVAFYHTANDDSYSASGWFIDDVEIIRMTPEFSGDFEGSEPGDIDGGWGDWHAEHGIWEVGTPTANPTGCYEGSQCAGTVLDGSYHTQTDSRLVSPTLVLPGVTGAEELHLRFWTWFSYVTYDAGYVQVSVYDEDDGWSDWTTVGSPITFTSVSWTLSSVELTAYAGQTVRVAFYHTANDDSYSASGWFVDHIALHIQ